MFVRDCASNHSFHNQGVLIVLVTAAHRIGVAGAPTASLETRGEEMYWVQAWVVQHVNLQWFKSSRVICIIQQETYHGRSWVELGCSGGRIRLPSWP